MFWVPEIPKTIFRVPIIRVPDPESKDDEQRMRNREGPHHIGITVVSETMKGGNSMTDLEKHGDEHRKMETCRGETFRAAAQST